eukprot:CAMPEP_0202418300 /NCGR_PEP_ID=MMETSP1128-20130828/45870_1 /ASSEMBLY_ACC=CAM_ASM_000463 /TAXON_ID=3047 /ORGANISM="Dunaliella tertiolecta, Strain CCMP1320" /LENGTH=89 /DNA_ID=CAMNT_0049025911 /DNA_START=73 /DNA_END=342 /DNA_ORIENTATION=-
MTDATSFALSMRGGGKGLGHGQTGGPSDVFGRAKGKAWVGESAKCSSCSQPSQSLMSGKVPALGAGGLAPPTCPPPQLSAVPLTSSLPA